MAKDTQSSFHNTQRPWLRYMYSHSPLSLRNLIRNANSCNHSLFHLHMHFSADDSQMNKALITPEGHYHMHSTAKTPNTSYSEITVNSWLKGGIALFSSNRYQLEVTKKIVGFVVGFLTKKDRLVFNSLTAKQQRTGTQQGHGAELTLGFPVLHVSSCEFTGNFDSSGLPWSLWVTSCKTATA